MQFLRATNLQTDNTKKAAGRFCLPAATMLKIECVA